MYIIDLNHESLYYIHTKLTNTFKVKHGSIFNEYSKSYGVGIRVMYTYSGYTIVGIL